jgi:uncharacterized protein
MAHFYVKLIPPRPTFAQDISDDERAIMGAHQAYTRRYFDAGNVLAYGPVLCSDGAFGIALVEFPDEASAHAVFAEDPGIRSGLMRYELSPMRIAASQPLRQTL